MSISSPTSGKIFTTSPITVSGTATDAGGSGLHYVLVDNGANGSNGIQYLSGNSASYSVSGITLAQGSNLIGVEAYDNAGNVSTLATVSVIYDTTPPAVSISSPYNGQAFNTSPITVSGTASDTGGSGLQKVFIDNGANSSNATEFLLGNSASYSVSGITLVPGTNLIGVAAYDNAGNCSTLATVTVTYNPGPSISSVTSASGGAVMGSNVGQFLLINGSGFSNASTVTLAEPAYSFNSGAITATYISSSQLEVYVDLANDGTTWTAQVNSGGLFSNTLSFSVSAPTPVIVSLSPTSAMAGGSSFNLTLNGSTFETASTAEWNGSTLVTTPVEDYGLTVALTAVVPAADIASAGTAAVTVYSPGFGGGTSSPVNFTITVATSAPTMALNSPNAGATWQVGTSQTVGWSITGNTSKISYLSVLLSTDNGNSYSAISSNLSVSTVSFNYTPTSSEVTTAAVIWVRAFDSSGDALAAAISSGAFTITNPAPTGTWGPLFTFPTWEQSGSIDGTTTDWNQYCPLDPTTGARCVTGCVATAEAQILYYWRFPQSMSFSTATDSYPSEGFDGPINIDADAATYDFPSFSELNTSLSSITYDGSANEEAYLSFAVGIKAQMGYASSPDASGASGGSAAVVKNATFEKFGFESADESSDWNAIQPTVISNIESSQPVLIAISGPSGGHAVVLDGYNSSNDTFHVDLGWGPYFDNANGNDDWYSLPTIVAGQDSFTSINTVVYDIEPILATPTGVVARQGMYSDHVHLTWNAAPEATGYEVWRNTTNNSTTASLITSSPLIATSYDDTTANNAQPYYYWIQSLSQIGGSDLGSSVEGYLGPVATTTTVTSNNSSPTYGQPVTFTATVTPAMGSGESGTVQFQVNGNNVGSPVPLSGNAATYTTSAIAAGSDSVVAVYSGDSSFTGSTSNTLTRNVGKANLAITADNDSKTYGTSKSFSGTAFTETGLVTANGDSVTGMSESSAGSAALATVGSYAIVPSAAVGSGLNNYAIAYVSGTLTVAPVTLTVTAANWTTAGLALTLDSDSNLHVYETGTTTDVVTSCPPADVANIQIASPSTSGYNLTIISTGNPIPAGGLTYSGAGGLIVTGSGVVRLSGTNTYTGGTIVSAGKLLINSANALPSGRSLTIGAGGTFVFDPSASAAPIASPAATATPAIAAGAVQGLAAGGSPAEASTVGETQAGPLAADVSSSASIATMPVAPLHLAAMAGTSTGRAYAAVAHDTVIARRYAGDSAAAEAWWRALSSGGQDDKKLAAIQALDALWAAYGEG